MLASGKRLAFVTLTSHEKLGAQQSVAVWPKAWKKLHERLRRAVPDTEYLFVPELHRDGRMHAHGIVTDAPARRWWKDEARACGFGYQDDMQEAETLRVVGYMAKYSAKCLESDKFPRGTRRFRASQGWPKLPAMDPDPRIITRKLDPSLTMEEQTAPMLRDGYSVLVAYSGNFWHWLKDPQG